MSKSYQEKLNELADDLACSYKTEPSFHVTSDGNIEQQMTECHNKQFQHSVNREIAKDITSIKPNGVSYTENKMVDSPPHYNQGGIEAIDYMKAYSTKEEFMGHCRLTAIKYLSRLMEKENPLQDAKKARWYLNKLIEELMDYE